MGPRIREDNGEGESGGRAVPEPPLRGVGRTAYNGRPQGSPLRKEWEGTGDGSPHPRGQREGESGAGGSRTAPTRGWSHSIYRATTRVAPSEGMGGGGGWVPAFARTTGRGKGCSPPSPVFTRAGSNLPPSRGKGFIGAERAVFLVMTGCDLGRQLGHGRYQLLHVFFVVEGVGGSSDAGELRHLTYNYAVLVPQSTHCLIRRNAFYLEGG